LFFGFGTAFSASLCSVFSASRGVLFGQRTAKGEQAYLPVCLLFLSGVLRLPF
jgi:hypothetical protein